MKQIEELPLEFKQQGKANEAAGIYAIPHPTIDKYLYWIIFSDGEGWEHLSVSLRKVVTRSMVKKVDRCPTWPEMCFLKNLFWKPNEVVVQYHPAMADYVNNHNWVLHLWKATGQEIPTPPSILVGLQDDTLKTLVKWLEEEYPGRASEDYLQLLYYADYSGLNLRNEKEVDEFKNRVILSLQDEL
jgi:hypothetical protein